MKKFIPILLILLSGIQQINGQNLIFFLTADSLIKNANSLVINYDVSFTQTDINSGIEKGSKSIMIFNEKGKNNANIIIQQDRFRDLTDFSGVIKNANGTIVKKIKKGDLTTTSFSESFATDSKYSFYEFQSPSYPYTIEYNYQIKYKNGIIAYPKFDPVNGYAQAVLNAGYQIEIPVTMSIRKKAINYYDPIDSTEVNGKKIYSCKINNLKAVNYEPWAPSINEYSPAVIFGPNEFCYEGYCGSMSNWNNYGKWVSELLVGRDQLPPEFTEKIKSLTENAKTKKEKAKIIYEYLQKNTRYVSIQLGIGGFQPIPASTVVKTGFGDCKGLTNLMKAMLKAVDISSDYCEIKMDYKSKILYPDYANVFQTNHAILCIPFENDTTWLECTSGTAPFGFIHDEISGHDALAVTENGGELRRLPSYPDSINKSISKMEIMLSEDGNASGKVSLTSSFEQYGRIASLFESGKTKEQNDYLIGNLRLAKAKIQNINTTINKSDSPDIKIAYDLISEGFANKSGSRLFAPVCPTQKNNYKIFSSSKREHDIVFFDGYNEIDMVTIQIPENHNPESLPADIELITPYGIYISKIKYENGKLEHYQNIQIFRKRHNNEEYKNIKSFFDKINTSINRTIVFKKV